MIPSAFSTSNWAIALVNHLWQSTAFAAVVWLLTFALRRNQAQTRHRLWVLASAKFLLPLSLLISMGEWMQARVHTAARPAAFSIVMEGLTEPFVPDAHAARRAAVAAVADKDAGATPANAIGWLAPALVGLWACGSLFLLGGWARRWNHLRRAARAATPLFTVAGVPVLMTPMHMEPGVFGVIRPVILLPEGIRERLSSAQLDAILAHELCHVRRRDNLFGLMHMVVESVFWFFPVVWWVRQGLMEERERACDEAVLDSRREATVYAEGIINVCKFYVEAPMSCVSGVTGSDLKKRIIRIMEEQVARKLDFGRKLLLITAAIFVVVLPVGVGLVHAASGQMMVTRGDSIEGAWQGTLHTPQGDQRMVVHIQKDGSGAVHATVSMLDHAGPGPGEPPVAASGTSFADSELKFSLGFIAASFDGKVSSDYNSIDGSWTQGEGTQRLLLARATPDTAWELPQPRPRMAPMAADAHPGVEVATIKPSKPDQMGKGFRVMGDCLITLNTNLTDLIIFAYDVQPKELIGGPSWMNSENFDIEVQPDQPGQPSRDQWKEIVQKLLADRFQLKTHNETRELQAYLLTVAKSGPKLPKADSAPGEGQRQMLMHPGGINMQGATTADLARMLTNVLGRPIVDQTGLAGQWDINMSWTPDDSQYGGMPLRKRMPPPSDAADAPPPLFTAIQEQLGLKLDSGKAQVPVLVLDQVERPSAN